MLDWKRNLHRRAASALRGAVAALALTAALPGAATAETLADALVAAYRNSGLLEQQRALLRAADEDVAQAVAALYPILSWRAEANYSEPSFDTLTATVSLVASLTLYDGGVNRLTIDATQEAVLALREGLIADEQNVLLNAVEAYMDVLSARAFVELSQNNVRLITEELRAANDRFEVGEITRTDVSIAEARLAEARSGLASSEGNLVIAREAYLVAVGRYPGDLRTPDSPPLPTQTSEGAKDLAVRNHPLIRQAQREVRVAEIGAAIADASRNPTVSLGASYGTSDTLLGGGGTVGIDSPDERFSRGLSLTLEGPVYQGGRIDSRVRQEIARTAASRAGLILTVEQIRQAAGNAFSQVLVTQAVLDSSQRQVRAQVQAFEGVREEATLGARTTLDVLIEEQELLDARANVIDAANAQYVAAYALLAAQGLLTAEYLNLGIPTYDPSAYYNSVARAPVASSPQGEALDRVIKALRIEDNGAGARGAVTSR